MPLMINEDSGQQRVVPARARSSYEQRGWHVAGEPDGEPPNVSDVKAEWVAYAEGRGVDVDGMTKAEIIDAVGS